MPLATAGASDVKSADSKTPTEIAEENWATTGWPLLQAYCVDCHNTDYPEAEVDLSLLETLQGVQANSELAAHAIKMIEFSAMPPEDAELPSLEERRQLGDQLDALVYHAACDLRPRPGHTTARRLNRAEYNNAIRDLFSIDFQPADSFPSDEVGGGFDNNADVLSLSTMLMDKYLTAAEDVTSKIIADPAELPQLNETFAGDTLYILGESKTGSFGQRYITEDGMAWFELDIPVGGEYTIDIVASPQRESLGRVVSTMHAVDGTLLGIFEHEHRDGGSDDNESIRMKLDPGTHRFFFRMSGLAASEREQHKDDPDWQIGESVFEPIGKIDDEKLEETRLAKGTTLNHDRDIDTDKFPMRFNRFLVKGPSTSTREDLPPGQRQLLKKIPERRGEQYRNVKPAAKESLKPLLRQAFRCEIGDEDLAPYVNLVERMCDRGDSYYEAMQVAISAALVSPRFLFRVEVPESEASRQLAEAGEPAPLSSTQLASRLSFFLWSSLPDNELLDAAKRNELVKPDKRAEQVRRMLADPKSDSLGAQFARQWFALGNLDGRDLSDLAASDGEKKAAGTLTAEMLSSETEQLFLHLLRENRPIEELLTSETTYIGPELAAWYGVEYPSDQGDKEFAAIHVGDRGRKGVLGHAGVLMITSYPTRNSPVLRGKWILENIMGTPPPDPPPGVPTLEETETASANASLREQLELHRADPGCASCHRVMDQLGFGLEDFDHLGRMRAADDPARRDATGELPGGHSFEGAAELTMLLADTERQRLAETTVRRMLTFAIGRELRPSDRCFVDAILAKTEDQNYRVRDLLEQVILSPPFLNHQAELPSP
ncbi:DUF1592 domain-containing protein [Allorhodopirellula solitaria]|nr:DUF1592 domain-containing protein [Allorhodopirellula solitaria]